jgi:ribosomal protein S18 acetylase RimI-like enzyme
MKRLDVQNRQLAEELFELQKSSYQVEAKLIDFADLPPLRDTIETLQLCDEIFYGHYIEDELVGAISYKLTNSMLDIHRVVVKPSHFRKGIAQSLLTEILSLHTHVNKVIVSTARKNLPAINLYKRFGFYIREEIYVTSQLTLVKMQKDIFE